MDAIVHKRTKRGVKVHTDADLRKLHREREWWRALNLHTILPTPYLHTYVADEYPSLGTSKNRLRLNYNKEYLRRPGQEWRQIAVNDHETYANGEHADKWVMEQGLSHRRSTTINEHNYHHELFNGCNGASLELSCRADPQFEYLSELQLHSRIPSGSLSVSVPIECDVDAYDYKRRGWHKVLQKVTRRLRPDRYQVIKRTAEGKETYCAFFLETDCSTIGMTKDNSLKGKEWRATLLAYIELIKTGLYMEHYGIQCGAMLLIVTNTHTQKKKIQDELLRLTNGKGASFILIQVWPEFAERYYVPTDINRNLLYGEWERVGVDTETAEPFEPVVIATM